MTGNQNNLINTTAQGHLAQLAYPVIAPAAVVFLGDCPMKERWKWVDVASKDEYKPGKTRKQAGGFVWRYV
jgi:hypothetical protein